MLGIAGHGHHRLGLVVGFLVGKALVQPFLLFLVKEVLLVFHRAVARAEQQLHPVHGGGLLHLHIGVGSFLRQLLLGGGFGHLGGDLPVFRQGHVVVHKGQPPITVGGGGDGLAGGGVLACGLAGGFAGRGGTGTGRAGGLAGALAGGAAVLLAAGEHAHQFEHAEAHRGNEHKADQAEDQAVAHYLPLAAGTGGRAAAALAFTHITGGIACHGVHSFKPHGGGIFR